MNNARVALDQIPASGIRGINHALGILEYVAAFALGPPTSSSRFIYPFGPTLFATFRTVGSLASSSGTTPANLQVQPSS